MNRRTLSLLLSLAPLGLVALAGAPARGQPAEGASRFNGTWRFASSPARGRQTIEDAIERAVDGMNFITQPIATGRLRDKNPLVRRIAIELTDARAQVTFDGDRTYRGALDQWVTHRFDGDEIRVQFRHHGDALVQLFRSDGGTRRNVYRLLPDGRMRLEVTLQADALPRDMRYRLTYRQ